MSLTPAPVLVAEQRQIIMKDFCCLLVALAVSAGVATLVTIHPTEALPMGTGYWSASF
jgi:hypothetical protein